jgi:outer membrane protein
LLCKRESRSIRGYDEGVRTKALILFFLAASLSYAEEHGLTLQQALEIASRQNPDVILARLDAQRSQENIKVVRDPFVPKVYAGSGAAYTYGYPNAINGNAPSVLDLRTDMSLFNKPQSYLLAAAREDARGVGVDAQARVDEVAFRTANLFLDAQQAVKQRETIEGQLPSLRQALEMMEARVTEGAELAVEVQRAKVNLTQAQHLRQTYKSSEDYAETLLAITLGYSANDRIYPAESQASFPLPPTKSEEDSVQIAIDRSKDLKRLQSAVLAKELEMRSYKAARLPQIGLVAQYALFAQYAYQDYFQKFQHNNYQIGASFVVPVLIGSANGGRYQEAATDVAKLRIQINQTRNRIALNTKKSYQDMKSAEEMRDLARQQLDLAHQDLSVLLSRYSEAKAPLSDVERARTIENQRWLALYETETQFQRARLGVLRQLGDLMAVLRLAPGASDDHANPK